MSGGYKETIHQTAGQQIDMVRGGSLTLTGERAGNYRISTEDYTGAITPRGLTVHSLYQDPGDTGNNPRNVKVYDGTNEATITHNRQVRIYEKQHARRPDDIISGAAERLVFRFWRTEF